MDFYYSCMNPYCILHIACVHEVEPSPTQHGDLDGGRWDVVGDDGHQHGVRQQHGKGVANFLPRLERQDEDNGAEDGGEANGQHDVYDVVEGPAVDVEDELQLREGLLFLHQLGPDKSRLQQRPLAVQYVVLNQSKKGSQHLKDV